MGHTRMYVTALSVLLLPAGAGVVTVHASPTCEKFVRTYITVPVRNRVSKATEVGWAKWRVGHPNWKPNPKVQRPRYRMSQRETIKNVAFACEVPTDPLRLDTLFTPEELQPPVAEMTLPSVIPPAVPPIETTDVTIPENIPPVVADSPPYGYGLFPPFLTPPYLPPVYGGAQVPPLAQTPAPPLVVTPVVPVAMTPEPSSLVLLLTGASALGVVSSRRRKEA